MKRYKEQIKFRFTHAKPLEILAYCKKCKKAGVSGKNIINGYHDSCYGHLRGQKCEKCGQSKGRNCCKSKCKGCNGVKPLNQKSCEACRVLRLNKRRKIRAIQRKLGTIRYENITPELIALIKYGKLPDMKRNKMDNLKKIAAMRKK